MNVDHGKPLQSAPTLGTGPGGALSVFTREWAMATITLDGSNFEVRVKPKK